MKLGTVVGLGLGHIVLDGDPAPPPERGTAAPLFVVHVYCGQTVANLATMLSSLKFVKSVEMR